MIVKALDRIPGQIPAVQRPHSNALLWLRADFRHASRMRLLQTARWH